MKHGQTAQALHRLTGLWLLSLLVLALLSSPSAMPRSPDEDRSRDPAIAAAPGAANSEYRHGGE